MMAYSLGIDLGTSGVKAGLLNLKTWQVEYLAARNYVDDAEQDPELLWEKTLDAIREVISLLEGKGSILTAGISGQMHGVVLYDHEERLISPIINWKDVKWSNSTILEKMKQIMKDRSYDELGTEIASGYSGSILYGIKENDHGYFDRIGHFILPVDYLRGRLMGKPDFATDPTNAFGTGLFNTKLNCWHRELIRKLSLPFNIFPKVHPTHQQAGVISDFVADQLGLRKSVPIIFGGGDNQMSMLGSGLVGSSSPILINIGTAAQISKVISKFRKISGMDTRSYFHGNFALVGASLAGGGSYQSLRREIRKEGADLDYSQMDELAQSVPPGADGLIYCSGPTRLNNQRRNGFFGNVGRVNSIPHRARAVLEGVLMDLYDPYLKLEEDRQRDFIIGAGKGLQKSRIWSRITADLFGKPLRITAFENAVFGAAIIAGLLTRSYDTLEEPIHSIMYSKEVLPYETSRTFYRDVFINYWHETIDAAGLL